MSKRILAAVTDKHLVNFNSLLEKTYETTFVHSYASAVAALGVSDYQLILCGVNFDGSRSMELYGAAGRLVRSRATPFIILRMNAYPWHTVLDDEINLGFSQSKRGSYLDVSSFVLDQFELSSLLEYAINNLHSPGKQSRSLSSLSVY